jgi:predicted nucleic acid-binding protein
VEGWEVLVSDTGPLISLESLPTGFRWIRSILDRLIIPPTVLDEVAHPYEGRQAFLEEAGLRRPIEVRRPETRSKADPGSGWHVLDEGEQEAISLARELEYPLLIEETAGRRVAKSLGCEVSGIAGLIDRARQDDFLSFAEATEMWRILLKKNRISESLYQSLVQNE